MPDLHFTVRDSIEVKRFIANPDKVHATAPFALSAAIVLQVHLEPKKLLHQ